VDAKIAILFPGPQASKPGRSTGLRAEVTSRPSETHGTARVRRGGRPGPDRRGFSPCTSWVVRAAHSAGPARRPRAPVPAAGGPAVGAAPRRA